MLTFLNDTFVALPHFDDKGCHISHLPVFPKTLFKYINVYYLSGALCLHFSPCIHVDSVCYAMKLH